ncbi:MAG: hypothetical protein ABL876_01335 [Chitinophagaceae bacterium]
MAKATGTKPIGRVPGGPKKKNLSKELVVAPPKKRQLRKKLPKENNRRG